MRIGLARGNQLLVAPVHMQYVTGFSRTERSKEPAMNGTSGFEADCEKLCRARLAGKTRRARILGQRLKAENSEPRTQNSELPTQHPVLKTANRFLHEQRHRFGTGARHLFHTHDLIALFTGISTKRETVHFQTPIKKRSGGFSHFACLNECEYQSG